MIHRMDETVNLQDLDDNTRAWVMRLVGTVEQQATELKHKQALLDKLTHEMAVLKRLKFAAKSEALHADQRNLLDETWT